jgi:hypothetical protein
MSFLIRTAAKTVAMLPPLLSARMMLTLGVLLPFVSARHRDRFRLIRRLRGPGGTMQHGPFAGMRYFSFATGSQLLPKFAGTYEWELRDVLEQIVRLTPDVIIDIGSAEGYYAVGLARRLARTRMVAFDLDPIANALCRILARANGVQDRVDVMGACSPAQLEQALASARKPLVICDVEGSEDEILRPQQPSSLRNAHVLVEIHEQDRPGVTDRIRVRFEPTHDIQVIPQAPRDPSLLPASLGFTASEAKLAMDENRLTKQQWLWMTPRP